MCLHSSPSGSIPTFLTFPQPQPSSFKLISDTVFLYRSCFIASRSRLNLYGVPGQGGYQSIRDTCLANSKVRSFPLLAFSLSSLPLAHLASTSLPFFSSPVTISQAGSATVTGGCTVRATVPGVWASAKRLVTQFLQTVMTRTVFGLFWEFFFRVFWFVDDTHWAWCQYWVFFLSLSKTRSFDDRV